MTVMPCMVPSQFLLLKSWTVLFQMLRIVIIYCVVRRIWIVISLSLNNCKSFEHTYNSHNLQNMVWKHNMVWNFMYLMFSTIDIYTEFKFIISVRQITQRSLKFLKFRTTHVPPPQKLMTNVVKSAWWQMW